MLFCFLVIVISYFWFVFFLTESRYEGKENKRQFLYDCFRQNSSIRFLIKKTNSQNRQKELAHDNESLE